MQAVLQLRRRKRLLKMMSQKEGALHNVTQLLDDLVSAEDDKAVIPCYTVVVSIVESFALFPLMFCF